MELQWKDAVGSAETLAVGLNIEILPASDECRERWGKPVQQLPSGSDKLMEKIGIRSGTNNDRRDFLYEIRILGMVTYLWKCSLCPYKASSQESIIF